ncbi:MAG: FAD-dependent oxidoreductase [Pseudomonadota bacterium]
MNTDHIHSENSPPHADVAVIGGGMVGSATALGLAQRGLNVVLVEQREPRAFDPLQPPDLRVSAINLASKETISGLGAWEPLESMRYHKYRHLKVWEDSGVCAFSAEDIGLPELGYFIENRLVQLAMFERSKKLSNLELLFGEVISSIDLNSTTRVRFDSGKELCCDWLIAADGVRSELRDTAGIRSCGWNYAQQVLGITVKMHSDVGDTTWQQFTPEGPMALLPMYDNHASLIWYNSAPEVARLKALDDAALHSAVVNAFPDSLQSFSIVGRASFPIQRMHANRYYRNNVLLIGDAAHCINPLAGQGVNLGFKDVSILLELVDRADPKTALDRQKVFAEYERRRRYDNLMMMSAMDGFYLTFSNRIWPLHQARTMGLSLANRVQPLKNQVLKYAVGC